jgi:quinol-cytochrome oxidoreductase complex cytochrome b subunit
VTQILEYLAKWIASQLAEITRLVKNPAPITPENKLQRILQVMDGIFDNLVSLFSYIVLVFLGLVLVIERLVTAADEIMPSIVQTAPPWFIVLFILFCVLTGLLALRGLLVITRFFKAYRIPRLMSLVLYFTLLFNVLAALFAGTPLHEITNSIRELFLHGIGA